MTPAMEARINEELWLPRNADHFARLQVVSGLIADYRRGDGQVGGRQRLAMLARAIDLRDALDREAPDDEIRALCELFAAASPPPEHGVFRLSGFRPPPPPAPSVPSTPRYFDDGVAEIAEDLTGDRNRRLPVGTVASLVAEIPRLRKALTDNPADLFGARRAPEAVARLGRWRPRGAFWTDEDAERAIVATEKAAQAAVEKWTGPAPSDQHSSAQLWRADVVEGKQSRYRDPISSMLARLARRLRAGETIQPLVQDLVWLDVIPWAGQAGASSPSDGAAVESADERARFDQRRRRQSDVRGA